MLIDSAVLLVLPSSNVSILGTNFLQIHKVNGGKIWLKFYFYCYSLRLNKITPYYDINNPVETFSN